MTKKIHQGQVALAIVLIMTVVSVLAISLASRSTVDSRIQQTESMGNQALLFAQSGVEQMLINPEASSLDGDGFQAVRLDEGSTGLEAGLVNPGESAEVSLTGADFSSLTGFKVYWGPESAVSTDQPAIYISVINSTGLISDVAYAYTAENGFLAGIDNSTTYPKNTNVINLSSTAKTIRVTALGAKTRLRVAPSGSAGAVFPAQTMAIKSTGILEAEDKQIKYGLRYEESLSPMVPSVFDYALFSGGSIVQ